MPIRTQRTPAEEAAYMDQTVAMTIDTIRRAHPDDDQLEEALNLLVRHVEKRVAAKARTTELHVPEGFTVRDSWRSAWEEGRNAAADSIDPDLTEEA